MNTTTNNTPRRLALIAGLVAIGTAGFGFSAGTLLPNPSTEATLGAVQPEPSPEAAANIGFANALSEAFQHAAARIEPSVVHITSYDIQRVQPRDVFGRRVGDPTNRERRQGLGSGVLIDDRGYLVTNNHVIENAERFVVQLYDGREFEADLIGTDPSSDIAVLQISAPGLSSAAWGDSEGSEVGQWVIAVGSPFGLEQTVTAGIISSKGRTPGEINGTNEPTRFQEFIQTDAAINPGNSGGPLVNLEGNVVGINTAITSRTGGNLGLGFAVPSDLVKSVSQSIIESGRVRRGFMGITWESDAIDAQRAYELGIPGGVRLREITEGGPADDAGLEPGDIIIALNGRATENAIRLRNAISIVPPGQTATVDFFRDSERSSAQVTVKDRFDSRKLASGGKIFSELGIAVLPRELNVRRGRKVVGTETGLQIVEIEPGSPAARSGLKVNDIILEVAGDRIESTDELDTTLERVSLSDGAEFKIFNGRMIGELFVKDE